MTALVISLLTGGVYAFSIDHPATMPTAGTAQRQAAESLAHPMAGLDEALAFRDLYLAGPSAESVLPAIQATPDWTLGFLTQEGRAHNLDQSLVTLVVAPSGIISLRYSDASWNVRMTSSQVTQIPHQVSGETIKPAVFIWLMAAGVVASIGLSQFTRRNTDLEAYASSIIDSQADETPQVTQVVISSLPINDDTQPVAVCVRLPSGRVAEIPSRSVARFPRFKHASLDPALPRSA